MTTKEAERARLAIGGGVQFAFIGTLVALSSGQAVLCGIGIVLTLGGIIVLSLIRGDG